MSYDSEEMEAFYNGFSKLNKDGQEQIVSIKEDFDNVISNSQRVYYGAKVDRDKYKKQSERYLILSLIVIAVSLFTLLK